MNYRIILPALVFLAVIGCGSSGSSDPVPVIIVDTELILDAHREGEWLWMDFGFTMTPEDHPVFAAFTYQVFLGSKYLHGLTWSWDYPEIRKMRDVFVMLSGHPAPWDNAILTLEVTPEGEETERMEFHYQD